MLDDPEAVIADGNSLLYSDVDLAVSSGLFPCKTRDLFKQ
jgi:hypothetical protein